MPAYCYFLQKEQQPKCVSTREYGFGLLFFLLILALNGSGQVFSASTAALKGCGSWNNTATIPVEVKNLPNKLSLCDIVLREVRVQLGSASCKRSLNTYRIALINPGGTSVDIAGKSGISMVGQAGGTALSSSIWLNIKYRDDPSLERLRDYSNGVQGNFFPHAIGYYAIENDGGFSLFENTDPNGTWNLSVYESGMQDGISIEKVELVFGSSINPIDLTTSLNNDNCSNASCVSNGAFIATNNGYSGSDLNYPGSTVGSCDWNGQNNNSAWFSFRPTSTKAKITISGMKSVTNTANDMQAIILRGGTTGDCNSLPTVNRVPDGGCPKDYNFNNLSYLTSNGGGQTDPYFNGITDNMEFNLTNLIVGEVYFLYVDGNGGSSSSYYIEIVNGVDVACPKTSCSVTISGPAKICSGALPVNYTNNSTSTCPGIWSVTPSSAGTINSSGQFTPASGLTSSVSADINFKDPGGCNATFPVTINTLPIEPAKVDASRCGPGTVTITASPSAATVETIDWYAAATAGSVLPFGNGTASYITPIISTTTVYYAESRNTITGCKSATRTAVSATVNTLPIKPNKVDDSRCGPGSVSLSVNSTSNGTYKWYSDAGLTIPVNTGPVYTIPVISSTTNFYVTETDVSTDCTSAPVTVTATVNSIPDPPVNGDASRCGSGTVTITASTLGAGETIDWYAVATAGSVLPFGNGTASYITPIISTTTVYYAESRNNSTGCKSATRTPVTATVNALPAAPAAEVDCSLGLNKGKIIIKSPLPPLTNYEFSLDAGVGWSAFKPSTDPIFTNVTDGSVKLKLKEVSTGCESPSITETVNCACPNPNKINLTPATTTGSTCGLTPKTISGTFSGDASEINVSKNIDIKGTFDPLVVKRLSPVDPPTNFSFTYTPDASDAGKEILIKLETVPTDLNLCNPATEEYKLTVNALPNATVGVKLGEPTSVCKGGTSKFSISGTPGARVTYNINGGSSQTIELSSSGSVDIPVTVNDNQQIELVKVADLSTGCEFEFTAPLPMASITMNDLPTVKVDDKTICPGGSIDMVAVPDPAIGSYTYTWTLLPVGVTNPGQNSTIKGAMVEGDYKVKVKDENSCESGEATGKLTYRPAAPPTFSFKKEYCVNDNPDALPLKSDDDKTGAWTQSAINTGLNAVGVNNYTFKPDPGQCATEVSIPVEVYPNPTVDAGDPVVYMMVGESVKLSGVVLPPNAIYKWTPDQNISDDEILEPVVNPTTDVTYTLTATTSVTEGSCVAKDEVLIFVLKDLIVPNVFSPNGDGINDKFIIENIEKYKYATVEIFNRYGQRLVRFVGGYTNPWDGKVNGKDVPVGTYFYVITPNAGKRKVISGSISIVR